MKYLQYTKYVSKDGTGTICLVPLSKAIHLPVQFQEDAVWYELLSSELLPYLIHRYAPIMTFIPTFKDSANPLTKSTYTDLLGAFLRGRLLYRRYEYNPYIYVCLFVG